MTYSTTIRPHLPAILLLVLPVLLIGLSLSFPAAEKLPVRQWGAALEEAGLTGVLIFLGAGALATSVGLPRQLVAFIGGLTYGVSVGLLLSLAAALAGCSLTANASRYVLSRHISAGFPKAVAYLDRLLARDAFLKIIVLRLQPLGTNLLTNLVVGITAVPLKTFLLATSVGYIPQMRAFTLMGAGTRVDSQAQLLLSAVLLGLSILLGVIVFRRHQRAQHLLR